MAERTKCETCNRGFKNFEGLENHNKVKHPKSIKNPKKTILTKKLRNWSILILVLVLCIFWIFSSITSAGRYDTFAKCLTESGAKMYGAYWCSYCAEQKKEFGKSFKKINYIECSLPNKAGQTKECMEAGIQSYPVWEFKDDKRISGKISLNQLSTETGCSLTINE